MEETRTHDDIINEEIEQEHAASITNLKIINFENYVKKPCIIQAAQLTQEVWDKLSKENGKLLRINGKFIEAETAGGKPLFMIETLEGVMSALIGDYLIIGIEGEIYSCKPDIFAKTYEKYQIQKPSPSVL